MFYSLKGYGFSLLISLNEKWPTKNVEAQINRCWIQCENIPLQVKIKLSGTFVQIFSLAYKFYSEILKYPPVSIFILLVRP